VHQNASVRLVTLGEHFLPALAGALGDDFRCSVVRRGDELLGLQRGLFCAGASTLLLSLWDVHDETTAELMSCFYAQFRASNDMAGSLRTAMQEIRASHPHPYFWAPFFLTGQLLGNKRLN